MSVLVSAAVVGESVRESVDCSISVVYSSMISVVEASAAAGVGEVGNALHEPNSEAT